MQVERAEDFRFEPTVFRAILRHRALFLTIVLACTVLSLAGTMLEPPAYEARTSVTVPRPAGLQEESSGQYLDQQVLVLRSPEVAERAASIANAEAGRPVLRTEDFSGEVAAMEVIPPEATSADSFGANTVSVSFTWSSPWTAQLGANSVVRAFDQVRSELIASQGDAEAAAFQRGADRAANPAQREELLAQRSQALVEREIDLAHHPTVAWAGVPVTPTNRDWRVGAAVGVLAGGVIAAICAFAVASRHGGFHDTGEPASFYRVPLLGEIRARRRGRWMAWRSGRRSPARPAWDTLPVVSEAFRFVAGAIEGRRAARGRGRRLVMVAPRTSSATAAVVAGTALAMADGGARVLAAAADPADTTLTDLLLRTDDPGDGLEQVLAGRRSVRECVRTSPLDDRVAVIGAGRRELGRVSGAAYGRAVDAALLEAEDAYDVVLVAAPGLLERADASPLVHACDGTVLVVSRGEPTQDHVATASRLDLLAPDVVGYVFLRGGPPPGSGATPLPERPPVPAPGTGGEQLRGTPLVPGSTGEEGATGPVVAAAAARPADVVGPAPRPVVPLTPAQLNGSRPSPRPRPRP